MQDDSAPHPSTGTSGDAAPHRTLDRFFLSDESRDLFNDSSPNLLLCGLPRAGKTAIARVVYRKSSPHETLYFQPTATPDVTQVANTALLKFNVVDAPGSLLLETQYDELVFSRTPAIIFVIDSQNEPFTNEIAYCKDLFKRAWQINPRVNFEVFIHKLDGDYFAIDEVRTECQRDIHDKLMTHLHEEGVAANVVFYSTSIYDHTIFEACSRVVQRLTPQVAVLEELLDLLVANCRMEKAFLIDVLSKTFIATDSSPFDPFNYELCTDMIDVVVEVSCIYGRSTDATLTDEEGEEGHVSSEAKAKPGGTVVPKNGTPLSSKDADAQAATSCLIQLNTGQILHLREVDRLVALACVIREENFDKQYLVDYNIRVFRDAMHDLFKVPQPSSDRSPTGGV